MAKANHFQIYQFNINLSKKLPVIWSPLQHCYHNIAKLEGFKHIHACLLIQMKITWEWRDMQNDKRFNQLCINTVMFTRYMSPSFLWTCSVDIPDFNTDRYTGFTAPLAIKYHITTFSPCIKQRVDMFFTMDHMTC